MILASWPTLALRHRRDGGPQFKSDEFQDFLRGIVVYHSISYLPHAATNGAAENFVETFKNKVDKIIKGGKC